MRKITGKEYREMMEIIDKLEREAEVYQQMLQLIFVKLLEQLKEEE